MESTDTIQLKKKQRNSKKLQETQPTTYAGTGVGLINSIEPAGDIVRKMIKDAEVCLKKPKSFKLKHDIKYPFI